MNIDQLPFLTEREKKILQNNKIKNLEELLYNFPFRFEEAPRLKQIKDIESGQNVSISGIITDIESKSSYGKGTKFTKAVIADNTDSLEVIWWHMPYVAKTIKIDQKIILTGTVTEGKNGLYLSNPKIEKIKNLPLNADSTLFQNEIKKPLTPVYSEIQRGKNKEKFFNFAKIVERTLGSEEFKKLDSIVPEYITESLHLPNRKTAILRKHLPFNENDIVVANKYFAFEEIFIMQIYRQTEKLLRAESHAYKIEVDKKFHQELSEIIPFRLTKGQENVLQTILEDMSKNEPMSRLVEGDVGSGKTILALAATLATVSTEVANGKHLQVAYIAPTEILASQHFEFFTKILSVYSHLNIALLTSSGAKIFPSKIDREKSTHAPKSRVKKLLDDGRLNIVIGTHALFNKNILFEHLGLVIIDEQHRFGVKQRLAMIEKHKEKLIWKNNRRRAANDLREFTGNDFEDEIKLLPIPHLLSMSATPIPRTLALTIYGDLDLSILDELPPGRKRATTKIITKFERDKMYATLEQKISEGKQAYIIAPRIYNEEDTNSEITTASKSSVEFEAKRIKDKFPKIRFDILHGKQSRIEKDKVINRFYNHEIDLLISTTVVEVGVSVANATVIIIENADTFGLAQLHQLRGRVERSTEPSVCFLVTETESETSQKRLQALSENESGFQLAEIDLSERGAGSLIGNRQSGLSDIGMEAIKNRKLVEIAKQEANKLLMDDLSLQKPEHRLLKKKIEEFTFHEE